jgi:hypothetical protein
LLHRLASLKECCTYLRIILRPLNINRLGDVIAFTFEIFFGFDIFEDVFNLVVDHVYLAGLPVRYLMHIVHHLVKVD